MKLFKFFMVFMVSLFTGYWITRSSVPVCEDTQAPSYSLAENNQRDPQSVMDIMQAIEQADRSVDNLTSQNRESIVPLVENLTAAAYGLKTDEIFPNTPEEKKMFAEKYQQWIDMMNEMQLKLRDKMGQFHLEKPLTTNQVAAFRKAQMYLDYALDFVIQEWALTQQIKPPAQIFGGQFPVTIRNKKHKYFHLAPGDVLLVRGSSFISSTIARSGDYPTNFSHVAMVVQDPKGNIMVAEALLETNLVMYSLDEYLKLERLSRAVVMRPKDSELGKRAALEGFKILDQDLKSKNRILFDIANDPNNHDKVYCAELVKISYETASKGQVKLPEFPMTFNRSVDTSPFFAGLGQTLRKGFSPADIYFSPAMDVVMVHRDIELLKQSWVWDAATSTLLDFSANRFDYKRNLKTTITANVAHTLKSLGFDMKRVPSDVSARVVETLLLHKAISDALHAELMKHTLARKRPLAYQELEKLAYQFLEQYRDKYFTQSARARAVKDCRQIL